jgi:glycosyltransferase involved in cell wall biosynthesis
MVTRLAAEKGLPLIIDAIPSLRARFPSLILLIAGQGPLEEWLRAEIRVRHLSSAVRLLGQLGRPEIQRLHHASDFHLYAGTIGCGMSIALLEAMAAGVLPIVSDVPREHRDLVAGAGWVFPANDAQALSEGLESALKTTDVDRKRLTCAVLDRIRAYVEPSLSQLLGDLLNAPAQPPPFSATRGDPSDAQDTIAR